MSLTTVKKLFDRQDYRAVLNYFKSKTTRNRDERNLIAMSLFQIGDTDKAVEMLNALIIDEPNYWGYANNLGIIYLRKQNYSSALKMLQQALKLQHPTSESETILLNIGSAYGQMGDLERAFEVWASIEGPKKIKAQSNIGYYLLMQGKFEDARKIFDKLVREDPKNIDLLRKYSEAGGIIDDELQFSVLQTAKSRNSALKDRVEACFLLARLEDKKGNYEEAENLYVLANSLTLELIGAYKRETSLRLHQYLKSVEISALPEIQNTAHVKPLFIVGMPRSGTTLLERVVSMHPEVTAIGESTALSDAINSIRPKNGENVFECDLQKVRDTYLSAVAELGVKTKYVLDKMPHNFRFVEFIEKCLPEAKIIHIKRDAVANAWSLFNTYFPDGAQHFSYSIDDIVFYYLEYLDLVTRLAKKYESTVLYVRYEGLIERFQETQEKIFNHLNLGTDGLNFSEFPEAEGLVRTASITSTRTELQKNRNAKIMKFPNIYQLIRELEGL